MGTERTSAVRRYLTVLRNNEWAALGLWLAVLAASTFVIEEDRTSQIRIVGVAIMIVLLSSVHLTTRTMSLMLIALAISLTAVLSSEGLNRNVTLTSVVTMAVATGVSWLQVRRRDRLGLRQVRAETVIEMIRDRLEVQAQLPEIGPGWSIEVERRAANKAAISGDFVASCVTGAGADQALHLAIVDVTGSGITAGPPALLLSGAVGGLLGAVDPADFLPAANDYLTRQSWSIGFASALYIRVVLATGDYEIRVAGHPPAMHYRASQPAGPARWRQSVASGTLLGVLADPTLTTDAGVLLPGDALIGFTDGLVEDRSQDLDAGVVRLQNQIETLAANGNWTGSAKELVERVPFRAHDDRTVVVIRRDPVPTETTSTLRRPREQSAITQLSPVSSSKAA